MDVEREMQAERGRAIGRKAAASKRQRIEARQRVIRVAPEAMQLLAQAKEEDLGSVTIHAQESILDAINGTPFGFDLIAEYRNLLQVPTLIRELWPYKPTIIRTLPMLDFARWICRVVYEECLTAKGLVKGKVNYICRGMRAKVVLKDPDDAAQNDQEKMAGEVKEGEESVSDPEQPTAAAGDTAPQPQIDETMKAAQRLLDDFLDKRQYLELRRERRRRMMIEGEAFLWVEASKEKEEPPYACFVEPDYIRPSQKKSRNQEDPHISGFSDQEDWSFGILTPRHQYWNPQAYQIVWNDLSEQVVQASDMFHTAVRERSNIKRCLPPMFAMADDLIRMTLLRAALADASRFRASIGGVVKYADASQEAVRNWEDTISGGRLGPSDVSSVDIQPVETTEAANIVSLTAGRDWVDGPSYPDSGSLELIYLWHIRAIAQAEQVPEWLVSGAMAEGSYASSLTAESVSVIEFDAEQEKDCAVDRLVLRRVMELYQAKNLLDKDFFEKYDIHVEGESMVARDAKAETETAVLQVQNEFCSLNTAQANLGFNPERERALIDAEKSLGVGPVSQAAAELEAAKSDPETMGGQQQKEQGGKPDA